MNRKFKLAAAVAIAALGLANQASAALTASSPGAPGSMFLYVYDDRTINTGATNSAIFDLGTAYNTFNPSATQTYSSLTASIDNFLSTISNPSEIKWGVYAGNGANGDGGGEGIWTTLSTLPSSAFTAGQVGNTLAHQSSMISYFLNNNLCTGAACVSMTASNLDAAQGFGSSAGGLGYGALAVATLGSNMDMYNWTNSNGLGSNGKDTLDATAPYVWSLSSAGVLSYAPTVAVPEADTYAMMLVGLGLVGAMVRRRRAS